MVKNLTLIIIETINFINKIITIAKRNFNKIMTIQNKIVIIFKNKKR